MSTLGLSLCIVIVSLSPFPFGLLLGRMFPRGYPKTRPVRGPLLAAASALLVWDMQQMSGVSALVSPNAVAVAAGIAAMLAVDGFSLRYLIGADAARLREYVAALPSLANVRSRMSFLLANLSGSIWEELVFRYLPFALFGERTWLLLGAIIVSSVLFGLQHLGIGSRQVAYSCALGLFFSLLVWATGSIWSSLAAHFVGNAFTVAVARPVLLRSLRGYNAPF